MSEFLGQFMGGLAELLGIIEGSAGSVLPTLVAQLENAGLAQQVRSWTGGGEKLPVSSAELAQAFPPDQLQAWADRAGTTPEKLLAVLAEALPETVGKAARQGDTGGGTEGR